LGRLGAPFFHINIGMYTSNVSLLKENWTRSRPSTVNFLRPNSFLFNIKDLPNTNFTCQSANLPALNLGFAVQSTPFVDLPRIGDKANFGEFTVRFIISEDMGNYLEIFRWLIALGFPYDYNQFGSFVTTRTDIFPFNTGEGGAYSDGILTILDSANNPKIRIIFKDVFPISLEALDFDVTGATLEYFTAIASFKYKFFDVEVL
jgi:hypothetical protein